MGKIQDLLLLGQHGSRGIGCMRQIGFMVSAAPAMKVIPCPKWWVGRARPPGEMWGVPAATRCHLSVGSDPNSITDSYHCIGCESLGWLLSSWYPTPALSRSPSTVQAAEKARSWPRGSNKAKMKAGQLFLLPFPCPGRRAGLVIRG